MGYLQHGRRHSQHGSDPTPLLHSALYGSLGGSTVVDGDLTYVGMDYWTWWAADQDTFGLGPGASTLSGLNGPSVLKNGVYRVSIKAGITGTAGDRFTAIWPGFLSDWGLADTPATAFKDIKLGETVGSFAVGFVEYQVLAFYGGKLPLSGPTAPDTGIFRVQDYGGSAFTVDLVEILMEHVGVDYDSTLSAGGTP